MPRGDVRTRMIQGAVRLLATNGIEGTSFADVLTAADAPRGSVYHHFPGGKTELLHAALDYASDGGLAVMETARGKPPAAVVARFLDLWRDLLDRTSLSAGCAVLAVTVAAGDDELRDHAGAIFATWTERLADLFVAGGMKRAAARELAATVVSATEGAVVLSRAQQTRDPFDQVSATLLRLTKR